jgi:hypothetical protein
MSFYRILIPKLLLDRRQISGTPMGSPLSSFLAESVMQDLEKRSVTNNSNIKTWDRYVDNVLATVKKDKTNEILQTINNTTENIKFTMEEEQNNQLASVFDILLTRTDNGTIQTQVYRKKTHTNQLLNYNSNHPTQHKISCIKTLFNRIDTHCNTEQAKQAERNYLYSTFIKNNYPRNFINKVLIKTRTTNSESQNKQNQEPEIRKMRISLPYITSTSEMTARLLRPFNIDVAHKPTRKLISYFTNTKI